MPQRAFRKKGRRGFGIDLDLGKNVPLFGGSSLRLGTRSVKKAVKRQILKQEETKKLVTAPAVQSMAHNTLYTYQLNNILQGTGGASRIGDRVFYCGITAKIQLAQKSTVQNSLWRFYIIKHRDKYGSGVQGQWGSGIGANLMFRNSDVSPWGLVNSDDVNVVCSKVLKVDQRFSGENLVRNFKLNCRIMNNFQYRTGDVDGEFFNYYLVAIPYSNTAGQQTTGTSIVADIGMSVEQVFKDA